MQIVLFAMWFFLPAGIANMMPVFAAKMPGLSQLDFPLDCKKSLGGKRIFGDHKTIRGVVIGILSGIVVASLQHIIYQHSSWVQSFVSFDYMKNMPLFFGFLLSFGALAGDSIKSFFKRRTNIKPGSTWFPFDQLDYIVGGILASLLWVRLSLVAYIITLVVWFSLHLLSTTIGFLLGLKESAI